VTTSIDARESLLLAAERLIGEGGVSVSLREIAVAAGQRNNSAVAYHFGSRDGLIEAVVAHRLATMEAERMRLLADLETSATPVTLPDLVSVLVGPMFTTPYRQGSTHYARFLEKARDHPAVIHDPLTDDRWPATRILTARLGQALDELSPSVRSQRLTSMVTVMFALLADAERRGQLDRRATREAVVDMLVGLLTAPVAALARR
jgi:AcrR family transcriptional regulator